MRRILLLALILLLGTSAHALEIKREMPKQIPPLSVHDILKIKKHKFFKILIYPLFDEEAFAFTGFKILIKINDYPKYNEDQK